MGLELDAMVLADCEHGLLPLRLPGFGVIDLELLGVAAPGRPLAYWRPAP